MTEFTDWFNLGLWPAPSFPEACRALALRLGAFAELSAGERVLDVGCGTGVQDLLWLKTFDVALIDALDASADSIARARQVCASAKDRIFPSVGHARALSSTQGPYDCVMSLDAAYFFDTRRRFFEGARRVLKPGGRLAVADIMLTHAPTGPLPRAAFSVFCAAGRIAPENRVGLCAYKAELIELGFSQVEHVLLDQEVIGGFIEVMLSAPECVLNFLPKKRRRSVRFIARALRFFHSRRMLHFVLVRACWSAGRPTRSRHT